MSTSITSSFIQYGAVAFGPSTLDSSGFVKLNKLAYHRIDPNIYHALGFLAAFVLPIVVFHSNTTLMGIAMGICVAIEITLFVRFLKNIPKVEVAIEGDTFIERFDGAERRVQMSDIEEFKVMFVQNVNSWTKIRFRNDPTNWRYSPTRGYGEAKQKYQAFCTALMNAYKTEL